MGRNCHTNNLLRSILLTIPNYTKLSILELSHHLHGNIPMIAKRSVNLCFKYFLIPAFIVDTW